MSASSTRAGTLAAAWARRPSRPAASALRSFYGKQARVLPLKARAEILIALGEAAEMEGRFDHAKWIYASALSACDPHEDERLYARAALRSLLNASRLGDLKVLGGIAQILEGLPLRSQTPRLACLGATARGLERFLKEDYAAARRGFEAAMGAAWESHDADAEALAHHLLAQAWSRLGKLARAREHAEAAVQAAKQAGSWILERRLEIEAAMYRLRAGVTPEGLADARRLVAQARRTGFTRFESMAWTKIARGILIDRAAASALLSRSEGLLPESHPDRGYVRALKAALEGREANGFAADRRVAKELVALVALARK